MEERFTQDDERWEQVNLNFDLLFARVDSMGAHQQRMEAQMDLGNKVMEQNLHDQQLWPSRSNSLVRLSLASI